MNNIRNGYREEKSFCYFHPKQVLVGVCPLCLNERLLILFAKQGRHHNRSSSSSISSHRLQSNSRHRKPPSSSIHKIFAFGSLFTRPESHHNYDYDDVSPTPEESFISIKFEENGVASWEKSTVSKKVSSWNHQNKENKRVIEHGKSRDTFRWRKRIGHMLQLIRWKKSGGVCHVGTKVEGVKVRKGWMRTLTKRKTTTLE
ncbi:hypothetical protein AAZX31_04G230000 [Glycine max]|uniref:Uncharacterized protein n=1 Tax=Glycine max TaxID=3847 RepID=I1JZ66_SOYBN|nr:uncharacterized protein LOC100808431 [Glycine max]KAH1113108.1 hypothetical protein GYH30_011033 [Glycine max]KAH1255870.1 hypothetical protein GmHk_04G011900 [Glycine max]KHN47025.1 hypothetical protein glysoja_018392 [Glycine soja]KRH64679.1 hypothetical protein GLYMA_04G249900v4 [Glycine max]|eukprot:XP_025984104.1 uncharacterized protein LOC100808431 [Glycine max]